MTGLCAIPSLLFARKHCSPHVWGSWMHSAAPRACPLKLDPLTFFCCHQRAAMPKTPPGAHGSLGFIGGGTGRKESPCSRPCLPLWCIIRHKPYLQPPQWSFHPISQDKLTSQAGSVRGSNTTPNHPPIHPRTHTHIHTQCICFFFVVGGGLCLGGEDASLCMCVPPNPKCSKALKGAPFLLPARGTF